MAVSTTRARRRVRIAVVALTMLTGASLAAGCTVVEQRSGAVAEVPVPDVELPATITEKLEDAVTNAQDAAGAPGALAAVWVPWAGSWEGALGSATPDGGELSADMIFRIGEVTRLMTCDVLYAEADAGSLEVNDLVDDYVPGLHLGDVTLKQLCDGTSGIGDGLEGIGDRIDATPMRVWQPRELASYGLADRDEVGVEARDSAAAFHVLGLALERASGESFATLVNRHVVRPNGLADTSLPGVREELPGEPALRGFVSSADDIEKGCSAPDDRTRLSSSVGFANSGVTSTISDLARYGQRVALESVDAEGEPTPRWARPLPLDDLGFTGGGYVAGPLIGQQGRLPGYLASVYADPETGLTVAVVLNNAAAEVDLVGALGRELAAIAARTPPGDGLEAERVNLAWTAEDAREAVDDAAVCGRD